MYVHVCFYRLGEMCSHVAALLFNVEACMQLGIASMTSTLLPCVWNEAFSKKVTALKLCTLVFICIIVTQLSPAPVS